MEGEGAVIQLPCFVLLRLVQAKLKALHEVVVRNRLEQLRKRQRDEAFQAQEELLAGVAKAASTRSNINAPLDVVVNVEMSDEIVEDMEAYDRAMSPSLLDITKLSSDDRQIDIILEEDDRRNLVSFEAAKVFAFADEVLASSINNVIQSPLQGLFRRLHNLQQQKSKAKKHLAAQISPLRLCTGLRRRKISTRRKNFLIWRRTSLIQPHTTGKTNIGHASLDTSIAYIRATSGTNITRRITSASSAFFL